MNVYMTHHRVAGVAIHRVSYPAIFALDFRSCYGWS